MKLHQCNKGTTISANHHCSMAAMLPWRETLLALRVVKLGKSLVYLLVRGADGVTSGDRKGTNSLGPQYKR